jgi:hypothetical protein
MLLEAVPLLSDVRPVFATNRAADGATGNAKFAGNALVRFAHRAQPLRLDHFGNGQFGLRASLSASGAHQNRCGMLAVLERRHIFQIGRPVVGRVAVFVIDLQAFRAWSDECGGNKAMDALPSGLPVHRELYPEMAGSLSGWTEYPAWPSLVVAAMKDDPRNRADAAKRRHFVCALVADDGAPLF